ncbi:hypothetical protein CC1G_02467 [Coprinopsis cinerea okayama7|uniref:Uncharacterized protein n=1 Tax=Coprinopsis cinerea (strain Okayama-7 / 130 / ATCC MYA-4618 / FGSC 9003) TaxID=240176 RepID=A8NBK7_COPC7|nr:hypothetical protein CC1G_02467 [Coprinopsis cinerea okayama7\|eukprot:XP_001832205.1 hypothetical protein CC1G_02467 [Coprinopsis cinerea okayama7\
MNAARSPLSVVFLLHIALEFPIVVQGLFYPASLPFLQLNNTALVLVKPCELYHGTFVLFSTWCAFQLVLLAAPVPNPATISRHVVEFLPGKRALAIALCVYHTACSTVIYQAPRFIPHTFGPAAEALKITPENIWGTLHGIVGLTMVIWWQGTVHLAHLMRQALAGAGVQQ